MIIFPIIQRSGKNDNQKGGCLPYIIVFSVVAPIIWVLVSFSEWSILREMQYNPYTGTFVQFLGEKIDAIINLIKDIA